MTYPNLATLIQDTGSQLGTRAGDPLPPQIALVLTKRTALRGKSGRGRMYLCGMSEDDSTAGKPVAALLTAAGALSIELSSQFVGAATAVLFNPVVVSLIGYQRSAFDQPPLPHNPKPPPIQFIPGTIINTMYPDIIWNTQRSRTIGVGR